MIVKIKDAQYTGTVYDQLPDLPEFAFAGRSNVGKSSLINALLGRKALVRTSKQPGKTRNINYFRVDLVDLPSLYMVDLPGYGYARVSHDLKDAWDRLASRYFHENRNLRLIILLVDIRRDLKDEEFEVLDLARKAAIPAVLVATKSDKLNFGNKQKRVSEIRRQCAIEPITSSVPTRGGIDTIWQSIMDQL